MANKMLIDAAHPEETRVVVVRGNRVEEFDFEAANRKQLRGNIYLAKVTRVEPSLQAAFVEYGGNRHGFLAFSEIHPDYYQIPVADRQALLEAEAAEREQDDATDSDEKPKRRRRSRAARNETKEDVVASSGDELDESTPEETVEDGDASEAAETTDVSDDAQLTASDDASENNAEPSAEQNADSESDSAVDAQEAATDEADVVEARSDADEDEDADEDDDAPVRARSRRRRRDADDEDGDDEDSVESVGAEDAMEEVPERRQAPRRHYKIQEVIKRRQIILVQVVKEERGNKGAALTTYLSLAGRYSVLMPNTARGGGISRKITQPTDRKRLKKIASELDVPEGMGVILRTAGASRTKAEIKRDFEYLMRLWETVRDLTLQSSAPNLVYEEGSLIKRSIRDLYNKDINEVLVAGEEGYREAKDFMRMLMPSHAKNVQPYRDPSPLFIRFGVEPQLDAMFSPQVTMKSGGYIVINQTEALVSIDVNSGKSTKEHNIEDTALQTNLEAAEEVARQLRLRDLAGLVVIDFIDMEENKNNRNVERKLKECLKNDRARIQVGRISHFGLLEMSRQRLRTGVLESSTTPCPTCSGTGMIRSVESVALHVLRSIEDNLLKGATHNLILRTSTTVALYILNQKRSHLVELEGRFAVEIEVQADEMVNGQHYVLDRGELVDRDRFPAPVVQYVQPDTIDLIEDEDEPEEEVQETSSDESDADGDRDRKRRRRRKRRRGRGDGPERSDQEQQASEDDDGTEAQEAQSEDGDDASEEDRRRKRRRGRRGGRRGRRTNEGDAVAASDENDEATASDADAASGDSNAAETGEPGAADEAVDTSAATAEATGSENSTDSTDASETVSDIEVSNNDKPIVAPTPVSEEPVTQVARKVAAEEQEDAPVRTAPLEPVVTSESTSDNEEAKKPKRGGWWQRRSFF